MSGRSVVAVAFTIVSGLGTVWWWGFPISRSGVALRIFASVTRQSLCRIQGCFGGRISCQNSSADFGFHHELLRVEDNLSDEARGVVGAAAIAPRWARGEGDGGGVDAVSCAEKGHQDHQRC